MDHLHLVYEDEILKLFWDTEQHYHLAEWHGAVKGDKLRTAAYACVNASRTRPASRWLADATDVGLMDGADQQWMVEDFYPRLCRNGVQKVAFVVPEKTLVHIPVRRMNKAFGEKGSIEFQYHPTRAAAIAWLETLAK
ncbi:MAG TPA: hypothetical protein VEN47_01075 [Myxococcota bacterium]|nr:hypothetical protein [Myxococcota bacterium]